MKHLFVRLIKEEQGQDLVEYALIVAAVGLALITTVNQLSTAVVNLYSSITQGLASIGASGKQSRRASNRTPAVDPPSGAVPDRCHSLLLPHLVPCTSKAISRCTHLRSHRIATAH